MPALLFGASFLPGKDAQPQYQTFTASDVQCYGHPRHPQASPVSDNHSLSYVNTVLAPRSGFWDCLGVLVPLNFCSMWAWEWLYSGFSNVLYVYGYVTHYTSCSESWLHQCHQGLMMLPSQYEAGLGRWQIRLYYPSWHLAPQSHMEHRRNRSCIKCVAQWTPGPPREGGGGNAPKLGCI